MDPERLTLLVEQNDSAAHHELFSEFYRKTYALCYYILHNREQAEDITQDAFIKAFQKMRQLREPEKFGAWLAVIASNLARNHLKKERRLVFSEEPGNPEATFSDSAYNDTERQVMRKLEIDRVRAALRNLPPEQQQVIVLQYYYDLKIEDIAAMLKLSIGTVKSRLFRARQRLSGLLEPISGKSCLPYEGGGMK